MFVRKRRSNAALQNVAAISRGTEENNSGTISIQRKKSGSGIFLRSRFQDCAKIIVALVEVFPFRAFSFHPLAGLGAAHLQRALHLSPAPRVD
jgi:hypothetical protein